MELDVELEENARLLEVERVQRLEDMSGVSATASGPHVAKDGESSPGLSIASSRQSPMRDRLNRVLHGLFSLAPRF